MAESRSLWTTAGGPSLEIQEIDYAEVLREKQGQEAALDEIIAAALGAPKLQMDDSGMRLLVEIVGDPARLRELMKKIETAAASGWRRCPDGRVSQYSPRPRRVDRAQRSRAARM